MAGSVWNTLEAAKLAASVSIPVAVLLAGTFMSRSQSRVERRHAERIELDASCAVLCRLERHRILEISVLVHNVGFVRRNFKSIKLSLRAMKAGEPIQPWAGHGNQLELPHELIKHEELIPIRAVNFIFVEPGVKQILTYLTAVPADVVVVGVTIEFQYDEHTPHSLRRSFAVVGEADGDQDFW